METAMNCKRKESSCDGVPNTETENDVRSSWVYLICRNIVNFKKESYL